MQEIKIPAQPGPGRFDPLPRILCHDDFDTGLCGWGALIGNYEGSLDTLLPGYRDLRPHMLSNLTAWDTGTAGALSGTYAMKLATRAQPGSLAVGIKRLTFRQPSRIRAEYYFTFKPEAVELRLSDTDVRAVGFGFALQDGDRKGEGARRVMPHLRYLNSVEGQPVQRWQFKRALEPMRHIGGSGQTRSHFHLAPTGWEDVPDGDQRLCYNEIATKQNWHYLRVGIDLDAMCFTEFRCNDRLFDHTAIAPMVLGAMPNLWCMLNLFVWVEADCGKRAFLYVDTAMLSAEVEG